MKTLMVLIILTSSIFATTTIQNECDSPYETFIKNREQENCKSVKIATLAFNQLQSLGCELDDLDIDLGQYVLEQAKYCIEPKE
jgi:hypothetical protein